MATTLSGSVGKNINNKVPGKNRADDILKVQKLLNVAVERVKVPKNPIAEDGKFGPETHAAILNFQLARFGWHDGVVDPGQNTITELDAIAAGKPVPPPPPKSYNYRVPGLFDQIAQPSPMACWATVGTMLYGWRKQMCLTIETFTKTIGERSAQAQLANPKVKTYYDLFVADTGLPADEHAHFATKCGCTMTPGACYTLDGWLAMLKRGGPHAIVGVSGPNSVHMRILIGMKGTGDYNTTSMTIVDPAGGLQYDEPAAIFDWKYEQLEARSWTRPQLWHY